MVEPGGRGHLLGGESEPFSGRNPEREVPEGADGSWRRVAFGQISGPLVPPHPEAPESPEEELTRAALDDPGASTRDTASLGPTFWRPVFLLLLAVAALGFVFWKR